ncbi:septum formation initiator family protein [Aureimonas sp. SK2]|uniref:FtsB family cell division protein n=1 Tax=Aureimonas sp. SK2 TaxID=3015992 RepID=UPI002443EABE|nr:septum formation initiator family protein [Aureimonas sp. SK2]
MHTKQKRRSWLSRLVVPAITLPCLAYFVSHAQTGRYGTEASVALKEDLARKQIAYAELVEARQALETRVRLLSDGTLERDMIDERARRALNLSNEDEVTILLHDKDRN